MDAFSVKKNMNYKSKYAYKRVINFVKTAIKIV